MAKLLCSRLGDRFIDKAQIKNHTVAASAALIAFNQFRDQPLF